MLCRYCQKNQSTKTHEFLDGGVKKTEYYCFACYDRLVARARKETSIVTEVKPLVKTPEIKYARTGVCSVCGRTEKEFLSSGLVGCANCYDSLSCVRPTIAKMQGIEQGDRHRGKDKSGSEERAELVFRRNEIRERLEQKISQKDLVGAQKLQEELQLLNAQIYQGD